jgi:hypothetical protein
MTEKELKRIQFFVATDKPLEETFVANYLPFKKFCSRDTEEINHKAKTILDLFAEVNEDIKKMFGGHWSYLADILPFDLKNACDIPPETIQNDIKAVLLDLYALRKAQNQTNLKCLVNSWQDLRNAGPHTPIFDPIFIFNFNDDALLREIASLFSRFNCPAWPPCDGEEALKQRIVMFMIACNHPVKYCLISLLTPEIKNIRIRNDVIEIIVSSPGSVFNAIDPESLAKIDKKTGRILEVDKASVLEVFSPTKDYRRWFSQKLAEKALERPRDYFSVHAVGFGRLDKTMLAPARLNLLSIKRVFDSQLNNLIKEEIVLETLTEQLEEDFKKLHIAEGMINIRPEIKGFLASLQREAKAKPAASGTRFGVSSRIKAAQEALDGMLVCHLVQPEGLNEFALDQLNALGLNETQDLRILPASPSYLSRIRSLRKRVEVAKIQNVRGSLDLFKMPR